MSLLFVKNLQRINNFTVFFCLNQRFFSLFSDAIFLRKGFSFSHAVESLLTMLCIGEFDGVLKGCSKGIDDGL